MTSFFYILDGHAFSYQAFFAHNNLSAPDGTPTNAIFGFNRIIDKVLQKKPEYMVVCFDSPGLTFRNDFYGDYKANRKPMPDELRDQIPMIQNLLRARGITVIAKENFEADDLMGTLAAGASRQGVHTYMLTGDKDIQQLVTDSIEVYDIKSGKVTGVKEVTEKLVAPKYLKDYFGLTGDSVDNIPGVKGVGPKTAKQLIDDWQNLETIYENLDKVKTARIKKLLEEHKDMAFLSRKLFTIDQDVDVDLNLDSYRIQPEKTSELAQLYRGWGFFTRLRTMKPAELKLDVDLTFIKTSDDLEKLLSTIPDETRVAIAIDGLEQNFPGQEPILALAWEENKAAYISLQALPLEEVKTELDEIFQKTTLCGYDLKRACKYFFAQGMVLDSVIDIMVGAWLLMPAEKHYVFENLCLQYLGCKAPEPILREADQKLHATYLSQKACCVLKILSKLEENLKKQSLWTLFEELEMPLVSVLSEMEASGILLNEKVLDNIAETIQERLGVLKSTIYQEAGEEFNISSTQQLGKILFEKFALPTGKKTKTGYSTNSEVLEEIATLHPLPSLILEYRQLSKLLNTYVLPLPSYVEKQDHRVHTVFHQTGTITGRLSSTDPNLQNIPIRTALGKKIRQAFPSSPECCLLTADYSQIELRILAHFSQDPHMIADFRNHVDIHSSVAAKVFQIPSEEVKAEQRRIAKAVNFGIIYGQTPYGLSKELRIPVSEAKDFIAGYFHHYNRVQEYLDETLEVAREKKFVTTISGRRRFLPDINSSNNVAKKFAERTAINTIMQGSAADIIKTAMINIVRRRNREMRVFKVLLQIHDELIFEVPQDLLIETASIIQEEMLGGIQLSIPLEVKVASGKNWLDTEIIPTTSLSK